MHNKKQISRLICLMATSALLASPALAEQQAKLGAGRAAIKRNEGDIKKKADTHVSEKLECSITSGAVGQYLSSAVQGVTGQFVGCHKPTPICFHSDVDRDTRKQQFISGLNTRFGTTYDPSMGLPSVPECAISSSKLSLTVDVNVNWPSGKVSAYVDLKWGVAYNNAQKVSFAGNNTYPVFNDGTQYPRANGSVITAYTNYDRTFQFHPKVVVDTLVNNVDVDLNLDYEATNVHYCEATHSIADQTDPAKLMCPPSP